MNFATAVSERHILKWASKARAEPPLMWSAIAISLVYLFVGLMDILSTGFALGLGAVEVNPLMAWLQTFEGSAWIQARLFAQTLISAMILFYPHKIVLMIVGTMVAVNAFVVWNNWHVVASLT